MTRIDDQREVKIRIRHVMTLPWYQPLWFFIFACCDCWFLW